jgi:hypothetical protein
MAFSTATFIKKSKPAAKAIAINKGGEYLVAQSKISIIDWLIEPVGRQAKYVNWD